MKKREIHLKNAWMIDNFSSKCLRTFEHGKFLKRNEILPLKTQVEIHLFDKNGKQSIWRRKFNGQKQKFLSIVQHSTLLVIILALHQATNVVCHNVNNTHLWLFSGFSGTFPLRRKIEEYHKFLEHRVSV